MKTKPLQYLWTLLFLASGLAQALSVTLTNARLIVGTGAAPVDDVDIVIAGGRIEQIGRDLPPVPGNIVIDAAGKTVMPGVIDTTSNTVEHPEVVAARLINFLTILGPERVIASTDCGFASTASAASVSGEVAWLKLQSMVEGARLAEARL